VRAGPAVVVWLVLLTGCSAFAGAGEPTPSATVTPAPVPEDRLARPPVVSPPEPIRGTDGVDARALAGRHAETLSRVNYTWTVSRNASAPELEQWAVDVAVVRVAGPTRYRAQRATVYRRPGLAIRLPESETYADGERVYVRDEELTSPEAYTSRPALTCAGGEGVHADAAEGLIARYLAVENATVERVETDDGVRFAVAGRGSRTLGTVEDYRVEASVTGAGRVERLRATWREGEAGPVTVEFAYRRVGTTVAPPPFWYATALEGATAGGPREGCRASCAPVPGLGGGPCAAPTPGPPDGPRP
jgi:hypothetical protein